MSYPNNLAGNRYRLMRGDGADPETFKFVCTATTHDLDEKVDYDDSMQVDCDDPTDVPRRVSVATGQTWDMSGSGRCDHGRYLILRGDLDAKLARNWQKLIDLPAAKGGGTYQGMAFLDTLKLTNSDNKTVTFAFTLKGQGALTFVPAAA